ncbi:hypothetical protein QRD89_13575 [Halobacillus sp. ACCC02827]|uniref:hypothetical protein n=1 Tax=Bacillaceae TaxID=186817 RepID=UPI0004022FF1|nr:MULTISPECIES: hypothetical protein [Bacillaceae]QHT47509.1 hypothetical protein M662_13790 [Bacillus sp. SB49]WJE14739.1 hypothetical protein QRD89_13575 [Halobacillus sp. ACCC02827]
MKEKSNNLTSFLFGVPTHQKVGTICSIVTITEWYTGKLEAVTGSMLFIRTGEDLHEIRRNDVRSVL